MQVSTYAFDIQTLSVGLMALLNQLDIEKTLIVRKKAVVEAEHSTKERKCAGALI